MYVLTYLGRERATSSTRKHTPYELSKPTADTSSPAPWTANQESQKPNIHIQHARHRYIQQPHKPSAVYNNRNDLHVPRQRARLHIDT